MTRNRNNLSELENLQYNCEKRLREIETALLEEKSPFLPVSAMCHNPAFYEDPMLVESMRTRRALAIEKEEVLATLDSVRHIVGKTLVFKAESMVVDTPDNVVSGDQKSNNENVVDLSNNGFNTRYAGSSYDLSTGQIPVLRFDNFLDRPVEIATGTIAVGANLSAAYPVWDLVTKHPSVRAKIKNHAYLRAHLVVRITLSGSPFHMGRIMCSYQPHAGKNANLIAHSANMLASATYRPILINYLSQAEGSMVMDARSNVPMEIDCPFILPKPMGRLFNASALALAAASSLDDFADMGTLYVYTITPIGSAAPAPTSLGYSIFAWLEDVEMSVPTATQVAITTESFKVGNTDERKVGPIERITTAMIPLSDAASLIPEIAPFAIPARMILGGVNLLASHFGWSRPAICSEPSYVKPRPYSNSSNCIGSETVEVLAYDPNREMTVDSDMCGTNVDDLALPSIFTRETFIHTFTWASSDAAYGEIWSSVVHPQLNTYYDDVGATPCTIVQPSAMSFAAAPFNYWRGDIVFRLDFETSAYHRGKLAIWFEPNYHHDALITADLALNKNYVHIVDIANTTSVEFEVQWASSYPWLKTVGFDSIKGLTTPGPLLVSLTDYFNGMIVVAPFTPLQSPDGSSIKVHVFARASNMLFQQIGAALPVQRVYITPESMTVNAEEQPSMVVLNPSSANLNNISLHYFGEQPTSFRALLKRYQTVETYNRTASATHVYMRFFRSIIPTLAPTYNGAALVAPVEMTLLNYLRYAYLGLKGGMRHRIRVIENDASTQQCVLTAELDWPTESFTDSQAEVNYPSRLPLRGGVNVVPSITGAMEIELPFYTQNSFVYSFADDLMGTAVSGSMSRTWTKSYQIKQENVGAAGASAWLVRDCATAEDFTLMRFCGAPYYTY